VRLVSGDYTLLFKDGGVEVHRDGKMLYYNRRPMFVTVKTVFAVNEFYDGAYDDVAEDGGRVVAGGVLTVPSGSMFAFMDTYEAAGTGFKVSRRVKVLRAADDLGFSTKISFVMAESDDPRDYWCFAPGVWYKQNEFAPDTVIGKDLDCEYFWRMETCYALPLFAMQHTRSGETASLSRWAADVTMPSTDILRAENHTDPKCTTGAIGMSRPESLTLNYMYYGFPVRKPFETKVDGLSIDYVYPGCDGQLPSQNRFLGLDYRGKTKSFRRINHPVVDGFEQHYAVAVQFGRYDSFQRMMRDNWRIVYERMRDRLFGVDNERHFHNCMKHLERYTRKYGESYGLPFAAQLPHMDISTVSFQFGFVGQQPGIGYLLLRYGDMTGDAEAREKGIGILDFWVRTAMTESGLPHMCYNPNIQGFEPYPHYVRMLADGIEAILDAYLYMRGRGEERADWLDFCRKTADWLVKMQNEDGSFYRAYNTDGSVRMDSKSNTPASSASWSSSISRPARRSTRRRRSGPVNGRTTTITGTWNTGAAHATTWTSRTRRPGSTRCSDFWRCTT